MLFSIGVMSFSTIFMAGLGAFLAIDVKGGLTPAAVMFANMAAMCPLIFLLMVAWGTGSPLPYNHAVQIGVLWMFIGFFPSLLLMVGFMVEGLRQRLALRTALCLLSVVQLTSLLALASWVLETPIFPSLGIVYSGLVTLALSAMAGAPIATGILHTALILSFMCWLVGVLPTLYLDKRFNHPPVRA